VKKKIGHHLQEITKGIAAGREKKGEGDGSRRRDKLSLGEMG